MGTAALSGGRLAAKSGHQRAASGRKSRR